MAVRYVIKAAEAMPDYPGRRGAEAIARAALDEYALRASARVVMRLLGYWMVWTQCPGRRAEIIDRGWLSRPRAYATEADFRAVFGVPVEEFDPTTLPEFLFGTIEETSSALREAAERGGAAERMKKTTAEAEKQARHLREAKERGE